MLAETKGSDCTDDMVIDEMFARGVILRDRQMRNAMVQAPFKGRYDAMYSSIVSKPWDLLD